MELWNREKVTRALRTPLFLYILVSRGHSPAHTSMIGLGPMCSMSCSGENLWLCVNRQKYHVVWTWHKTRQTLYGLRLSFDMQSEGMGTMIKDVLFIYICIFFGRMSCSLSSSVVWLPTKDLLWTACFNVTGVAFYMFWLRLFRLILLQYKTELHCRAGASIVCIFPAICDFIFLFDAGIAQSNADFISFCRQRKGRRRLVGGACVQCKRLIVGAFVRKSRMFWLCWKGWFECLV